MDIRIWTSMTIDRVPIHTRVTILRYYDIMILRYYDIAIFWYYDNTILRYNDITTLRYYDVMIIQYYDITISRYHDITKLQYYNITCLSPLICLFVCLFVFFFLVLSSVLFNPWCLKQSSFSTYQHCGLFWGRRNIMIISFNIWLKELHHYSSIIIETWNSLESLKSPRNTPTHQNFLSF